MKLMMVVATLLAALSGQASQAADFSTPEAALRALEAAYVARDIDAAVAAKDFRSEARAMLLDVSGSEPEPGTVSRLAESLELAFRKEMKDTGFPEFDGLRTRVVSTKQLAPGLVEMSEEITFPDGYVSTEKIHAALRDGRWGIVVLSGD